MFGRLVLLAILALPLVEIALFILIGKAIGVVPTLLGVLVAGIAGALVLRWQGLATLRNIQAMLQRGEMPARQVGDAMLIGLGGVLLLLPGYCSDFVGILLVLPPVRRMIYRRLARHFKVGPATARTYGDPQLLDLDQSDWRER